MARHDASIRKALPDQSDLKAAERNDEFIERLDDDGLRTGLIAIAPHGGDIERHTDEQAELLASALTASCWRCKGWHRHGAKTHWHITAAVVDVYRPRL